MSRQVLFAETFLHQLVTATVACLATSLLAMFPDPFLEASGSGNLATSLYANMVAQKEPDGLLLGRFISLLPSEDLGAICTWSEFRSPAFFVAFAFTEVRWENIDNK